MIGLFQNVGESFKFGFSQCYANGFKGFLRMLALLALCLIPIINFIPFGIFMKVFRGEKPDFTNAGDSFIRGLLFFVVGILYMLVPGILFVITFGISYLPLDALGDAGEILLGLLLVIFFLAAIVSAVFLFLIAIPAQINFARNGFAAAFKFSEILGMISRAGVAKYLLSYLILLVIMVAAAVVLGLLIGFVPVVGIIVAIFVAIPLLLFEYRFWANRFEP